MIAKLWTEFFELWEQRNNLVHGKDKTSKDVTKCRKVIIKIKHLHSQQDAVVAAH
jgi:hypothetical protein